MRKLSRANLLAALLASVGLVGVDAPGAELQGALQYPPASVGRDAQPLPPARMLSQRVAPWRIELGVSGSSLPPSTQRFYILSPLRFDRPGAPPATGVRRRPTRGLNRRSSLAANTTHTAGRDRPRPRVSRRHDDPPSGLLSASGTETSNPFLSSAKGETRCACWIA
jgi:hypothetical protein